jgi:diguanylate cyclase (GGDEF)-like protein
MSLQGLPKRWTSVATVNGDAEHHSLDGLSSVPAGVGAEASFELVLQATRSLLWIKTEADACAVARELVENLGGTLVSADESCGDALPLDVSFGVGQPKLPSAPPSSIARMFLERRLPGFVRDANRALELANQANRLAEDASIDLLTGLPNRRMLGRALGRIEDADAVIMIDLDYFKTVNDNFGHDAGDRVLAAFGRTLLSVVRAKDHVGRYGGEEFMVILPESSADRMLARLQAAWALAQPRPVTFSAGIAPARPNPQGALNAADRAMYRAKELGRDQCQWATEEDYQ